MENKQPLKDELSAAMHSEFTVDEETEIRHRCITIWCDLGADPEDEGFEELCYSYELTVDQVMANRDYCMKLKNE